MSHYGRGRAAEHRARKVLEDDGFSVVRSAGSKGLIDLVAWNSVQVRFIQTKRGSARLSGVEREAFAELLVPPGATKEYWRMLPRKAPLIELL